MLAVTAAVHLNLDVIIFVRRMTGTPRRYDCEAPVMLGCTVVMKSPSFTRGKPAVLRLERHFQWSIMRRMFNYLKTESAASLTDAGRHL